MSRIPEPTRSARPRAFLVGVDITGQRQLLQLDDSLRELERLADTAGLVVVGHATQRLRHPDPKTYIRSGKVQEVRDLVEDLVADVIIFDDELSPRHQRELEKAIGDEVQVLDRTALILDIFAQHANTSEGALQVQLAQYEYRLPRLTRAWTHLARQAGGGGGRAGRSGGVGLRGPGETQLEVDRREIGRRIAHLRKEIEKLRAHRQRYRSQRRRGKMPTVAMVGYTNAGKSTLLNRLSDAEVLVANQLFATLDPTTRRIDLPGRHQTLLTDTVGFIQKLPTTVVEAFRATLEEIAEADLLLHLVDISHPNAEAHALSVLETLEEIEVREIPIVTVLNKIDLVEGEHETLIDVGGGNRAFPISAVTGEGIPALLASIEEVLFESMASVHVLLPYRDGGLISLFHERGTVERSQHMAEGVEIEGRIPTSLLSRFRSYQIPAPMALANGEDE